MMSIPFLNSEICFADRQTAVKLISVPDEFTSRMSAFDLQSRLHDKTDPTVDDYLKFAADCTSDWNPTELELLKTILVDTEQKIAKLQLKFDLPETIYLIRSTLQEEGSASGYTRRNFIVLNYERLSQKLLEHELWHIISRKNDALTASVYGILGFKPCNEIQLPEPLNSRSVTNPDAPKSNHYLTINYGDKDIDVAMVIYSDRPYEGGKFFEYINKGLIHLVKTGKDQMAVVQGSEPLIISYEDAGNLYEQIGKNTNYTIHPEEITADHFVFGLNERSDLPDQHLVDRLMQLLRK